MTNKNTLLTEGSISKTLTRLTLPMILGMLGMIIFNMVDTFYVGKLGTDQLAALTFTFPVVLIINSLAQGIGVGASSVIAKAVGEGNHHKIQRYTTDSLLLGVGLVFIFVVTGLLTIEPLFRLLGASPEIMPYIIEYMRIWYLGVIFVVIPMIGNSAIRALGDTKTPSLVMTVSAGVNIILDPIMIFGFGFIPAMGVSGAALATLISRAITLCFALYILIVREKLITFHSDGIHEILDSWKDILYIGLPNALTKMMTPVAAAVITGLIATYGTEAVAGFGIATRLEMFALMVSGALATVLTPFIGQNLGAGKMQRVRTSIRFSEGFVLVYGLAMTLLFIVLGPLLASLFTTSQEVIGIVQRYLWIVPFSYGVQGILLITTTALNVFNKPMKASVITLVRMFGLYLPMALLGSQWLGLNGIWLATVVSFIVAAFLGHLSVQKELGTVTRDDSKLTASMAK